MRGAPLLLLAAVAMGQDPTPAPPALYTCAKGSCVPAASGIDQDVCRAMCHAPAPPAPVVVYTCTKGACAADDHGIDLKSCQSMCHAPPPPAPPAPPSPSPVPGISKQCVTALDQYCGSQQGPYPGPDDNECCGLCTICEVQNLGALTAAGCRFDANPPHADGNKWCRAKLANPRYHCDKTRKCIEAASGHSTREACEQACGAPPPAPPPAATYTCEKGSCVAAAAGIDLKACRSMCHPPAPTPPAPSGDQYQCTKGVCTVTSTGIDLKTCQSMCHPPVPSSRVQW